MKLSVLVMTICIAAMAWGQGTGQSPQSPSVDAPGKDRVVPLTEVILMRARPSYGHALGFVNVTDFSLSGRGYISLGKRQQTTPELSFGFLRMNSSSVPETFINGYVYTQGLFVLPLYLGVRYNLIEESAGNVNWSWFLRGGGGPAVGMLAPIGLGFFDSFNRTSFHFGIGASAATGVEFSFDNQYTIFMQGGADYLGFFRQIGDRGNFFGPSFSIGFGKLLP